MSKTLIHKLFGFGKLPKRYAPTLRAEGIVLLEEGIGGSITLKNFRGPGRYHSWKRNWFSGSLVLTERTFAAFALFRPLIFIPLDDARIKELKCTIEENKKLTIIYDASLFNEKWKGTIECRFKTDKALMFQERLMMNS